MLSQSRPMCSRIHPHQFVACEMLADHQCDHIASGGFTWESKPEPLTADAEQIRQQKEIFDTVAEGFDAFKAAYRRAVQRTIDEFGPTSRLTPGDPTQRIKAAFGRNLREEVVPSLHGMLRGVSLEDFRSRGFPLPGDNERDRLIAGAIRRTLQNDAVADLVETVKEAVRVHADPNYAGGKYTVERLLSDEHVAQITRSLSSNAQDEFEDALFKRGQGLKGPNGLTGKRRWVSSGKADSRHAELNGIVVDAGEDFQWQGDQIRGPRANPADVKQWSNCECSLTYETNSGTWI